MLFLSGFPSHPQSVSLPSPEGSFGCLFLGASPTASLVEALVTPCLHCCASLISRSYPAFTSGGCHSSSFSPGFLGHPPAHRSLQFLPSAFVLPSASPWGGAVAPTLSDRQGFSQSISQRRKVGFREWRSGTMVPLLINNRPRVWLQVQPAGHSRPITVQSQASSLRRCLCCSDVELAAWSLNLLPAFLAFLLSVC